MVKAELTKWIALATALGAAFLGQGCFDSTEWGSEQKTNGNRLNVERAEKVRLLNGELVGRALVLYAVDHDGVLPTELTSLAPGYLGTNISLDKFELFYPGETNRGAYVLIAAERSKTNARNVVIRADGIAYLLRPGD